MNGLTDFPIVPITELRRRAARGSAEEGARADPQPPRGHDAPSIENAPSSALLRSEGSTAGAGAWPKVRPLSQLRAHCLKWGAYEPALCRLGEGLGLDLSVFRCALCEGKFPVVGEAMFFLDEHGGTQYLHRGCMRDDVEAWAWGYGETEEPA